MSIVACTVGIEKWLNGSCVSNVVFQTPVTAHRLPMIYSSNTLLGRGIRRPSTYVAPDSVPDSEGVKDENHLVDEWLKMKFRGDKNRIR
jgi:hypothetical protein